MRYYQEVANATSLRSETQTTYLHGLMSLTGGSGVPADIESVVVCLRQDVECGVHGVIPDGSYTQIRIRVGAIN